jgi:hypothetical protein
MTREDEEEREEPTDDEALTDDAKGAGTHEEGHTQISWIGTLIAWCCGWYGSFFIVEY